jgi:hypothetical protein
MAENTFLIRIWREPTTLVDGQPEYRGIIQHVSSGERCFVASLVTIREFIGSYVPGNPPASRVSSLQGWLNRQRPLPD